MLRVPLCGDRTRLYRSWPPDLILEGYYAQGGKFTTPMFRTPVIPGMMHKQSTPEGGASHGEGWHPLRPLSGGPGHSAQDLALGLDQSTGLGDRRRVLTIRCTPQMESASR